MAKRGPKPYRPGCRRLMPVRLIAQRLGVSVRTVHYDLNHAIEKLRNQPLTLTEVR
jgi:transcriptional antiterminator